MNIQLVALNAQYIHTNLAVRSIAAYCAVQNGPPVHWAEYTINQPMAHILESLVRKKADVYLFSCYIWNIEEVCALARELKKLRPAAQLWAGGPQVSWHCARFLRQNPAFTGILRGEGEHTCLALFHALQGGASLTAPTPGTVLRAGETVVEGDAPAPLPMDALPFAYADAAALSGRILYYESMRGCPFSCSYCLSSVENGVRFKSLPRVQEEMLRLLAARPKQVKFVDRTFNCNAQRALALWRFLAENDNGATNFHFELAGELLTDEAVAFLATVRLGLFQFEIGVQSTHAETLRAIQRPANLERLFGRVAALQKPANIHLHLDLIAGLPFEGYENFARSFNEVYAQRPHQLQLGFLKVLAGSGMERQAEEFGLCWQSTASFEVLYTRWLSYEELRRLSRVAHMVELYYNSGRFSHLVGHLSAQFATPFAFYEALADLYEAEGYTERPLSKIGQYELPARLLKSRGLPLTAKAQWLCLYDMALHEKIKKRPAWVEVATPGAFAPAILAFYGAEENRPLFTYYGDAPPKQLRRMCHIERLPFCPKTGEESPRVLLFDYARRTLLGHAEVRDVTPWFTQHSYL